MRRAGTSEGANQQPGGELCRYYSCVWVVVVVVGVSSTEDRCRKTVPPASKMVVTSHRIKYLGGLVRAEAVCSRCARYTTVDNAPGNQILKKGRGEKEKERKRKSFFSSVTTYGSGIGPVFWPVADRTVSSRNFSTESSIPIESCVRVKVPLMPEVALVEFPPRNGLRSKSVTCTPPSISVCAAESPERPPPTTIADGIVF